MESFNHLHFDFFYAYLLVLISVLISLYFRLEISRSIFFQSIRAFLQLALAGIILTYILQLTENWQLILACLVMTSIAALNYSTRHKKFDIKSIIWCFIVLLLSSVIVVSILTVTQIIPWKAQSFIPLYGLILGNSLNVFSLTISQFKDYHQNEKAYILNYIALGANQQQATFDSNKKGIKNAMIPAINSLKTVGIIHMPGIMVGMIIAGANPMTAVSYQLVIMYLLLSVSVLSAVCTIYFSQFFYRLSYQQFD